MIKYPLYVTLDTNIFDANKLDFSKESTLGLLVNCVEAGKLKVVLSNIVIKEVERHVIKSSDGVCASFRELRKQALNRVSEGLFEQVWVKPDTLFLDKEKYRKKCLEVWKKFLNNLNPEILDLTLIDLDSIIDDYFDYRPPFENNDKKRKEFPDAFTLMAIEHWSSQNDILTICISCDKDWEEYCKNSEYLFYSKNVSYLFETLFKDKIERDERTELIKGNIDKFKQLKHEQLANEISYAVENTNNFNLDYESSYGCDCEINNTILNNYNIKSYEILSIDDADNDTFTYDISFNVLINITIEYSYEIYIYDSIDKDYITLSSGHRTIDTNVKIDVSIEFEGDNGDIINIYNIDIPNTNIDIGSVELGDEFYCSDDEE